jgi:hypothetical protein
MAAVGEFNTMKWLVALGTLLLAGPAAGLARAQQPTRDADRPVTFTHDIAPILYSQCTTCHRPDGPAPFSLITYDEARRRLRPAVCRRLPQLRDRGAGIGHALRSRA